MKEQWEKPELEILTIHMTMAGPGLRIADAEQTDPDEDVHYS
ncbi:recombinase RecA [Bacillus manliponensis]|uniref:Recombinase RecA n=1 Tax=Bacillus manliponensis TaxID=574376 RepID=A0A073K1H4_9BACI|nr:paeninodin family lasso peptide [Bacillus manliponensis]KEK20297.1 recombinase RecA [Bacillus manliponensis]